MVTVGARIQRFEVTGHLGSGGMGSVFRARDPQLERDVAIKLLARPPSELPRLSENETVDLRTAAPAGAEDLLREARMMARLSHPNVLPVYEVGLVEDAVFVVMECIDGCDLRTWLAEPRGTPAILAAFAQAARGLEAAHAREIVHRDFKPENVLVGSDERVRVADFGLSRLAVRSTHSMRRIDEDHGTPRYMAPELWRGDAATKASDVFAFCVALGEAFGAERGDGFERALRDRELNPRLREAIAAGVAEDPAARPALATLVQALERRSRAVPRRLAVALGGVAVIGIGAAVALANVDSGPSCSAESGLAAGRWDAARRAELLSALEPAAHASTWARDTTGRIVSMFDDAQADIETTWHGMCAAKRDGALTDAQASAQHSCLERRAFELAARVDQVRTSTADLGMKLEGARVTLVSDCAELTAPPISDRTRAAALFRKLIDLDAMPQGAARIAPLEALVRDAAAAGEVELEARARLLIGVAQREADQLPAADATLERAYKSFVDLHSNRGQAATLLQRSRTATRRGDDHEATSLAKLALELVEHGQTSPAATALVYNDIGRSTLERGDAKAALALLDKGLAVVAKDGHRLPTIEGGLRIEHARALGSIEGKRDPALADIRATVEWTRTTLGDTSALYASALGVLAIVLQSRGDVADALPVMKQALDATIAGSPPGDTRIEMARGNYAGALEATGHNDEALALYTQELAAAEHSASLRAFLPLLTARVGSLKCRIGHWAEGLPMIEHAIELGTAQYGADHRYTQEYRKQLLAIEIELGKDDDAEKVIATLETSYRAQKDDSIRSLTMLALPKASIALHRGKPREAEQLARTALASWDELKGDDNTRAWLYERLGRASNDQRKWAAAQTAYAKALAILTAEKSAEDDLAMIDIGLARTDAGLGKLADAIARAHHDRAIFERFPLELEARRQADAVLALDKHARKR